MFDWLSCAMQMRAPNEVEVVSHFAVFETCQTCLYLHAAKIATGCMLLKLLQ